MSARQTGKTREALEGLLRVLRADPAARVAYAVHTASFVGYARSLLRHMGATREEFERIQFFTVSDQPQRAYGHRVDAFKVDHAVREHPHPDSFPELEDVLRGRLRATSVKLMKHVWTEIGNPWPESLVRAVQCEPCGLMAMTAGGEYVAIGSSSAPLISPFLVSDGDRKLRFTDHAPKLPLDDVCQRPLPVGTVVFHRSTQEWAIYEPKLERMDSFIILAAQEGVVFDAEGRVRTTSSDGREVTLLLRPYEVRQFWSMKRPASVWARLG